MSLYRFFTKAGMPSRVPSLSDKEIENANASVKKLQERRSPVEVLDDRYATTITHQKKGHRSDPKMRCTYLWPGVGVPRLIRQI